MKAVSSPRKFSRLSFFKTFLESLDWRNIDLKGDPFYNIDTVSIECFIVSAYA